MRSARQWGAAPIELGKDANRYDDFTTESEDSERVGEGVSVRTLARSIERVRADEDYVEPVGDLFGGWPRAEEYERGSSHCLPFYGDCS